MIEKRSTAVSMGLPINLLRVPGLGETLPEPLDKACVLHRRNARRGVLQSNGEHVPDRPGPPMSGGARAASATQTADLSAPKVPPERKKPRSGDRGFYLSYCFSSDFLVAGARFELTTFRL